MTQATTTQAKPDLYLGTEEMFLTEVKNRINQILVSSGPPQEILDYIQINSGKMLRPLLVFYAYQLCNGKDYQEMIDVASGVELIHIASLIHDDIIDQSNLRRGTPTVHCRYGSSVAVLAGDFLFAKAFYLFANYSEQKVLSLMTDVICQMCAGEIEQLIKPGQSETYYWNYILKKTACLLGSACKAGALIGSNLEVNFQSDLEKFGRYLGYAFQLVDDILDYLPISNKLGKELGDDYARGLWTLPIIRGVDRGYLSSNWQRDYSRAEITKILEEAGILQEIFQEADLYVDQAIQLLAGFPDSPAKLKLEQLADFVRKRSY